jgi:prolyl-tRNA synthetase
MFSPTLRETPAEAEIISHKLLVRAGFIRKSSAGIYSYLPMGQRVLKKIENIVRQEMDGAGSQEIMMPILQPAELWLESGRWYVYGGELMRLKDRHDRDFCLGPTHEELITALVRDELNSWRQLPLRLYQIQNKYRDERRPRFGLMRGREFVMKDLYSFDRDEAGLDQSYQEMFDAYVRVFSRCGLDFRSVEADSGAIGGSFTHEFMVLAESGEAEIIYCSECSYAADGEIASAQVPSAQIAEEGEMMLVATPGQETIQEVAAYLQIPESSLIKTLFYEADGKIVCVLLRGDRSLNEIKLKNALNCLELDMAENQDVLKITGCQPGYVSPIGLTGNIPVYADDEVRMMVNGVAGANQKDYHFKNVKPGRDFKIDVAGDFRQVQPGDACPKCGKKLKSARGIEAGQVFKLGTKYSEKMNLHYTDENGEKKLVVMGCYGIGVSRTLAAAVEQNYDKDGIIWPIAIAPYHVVVVPTATDGEIYQAAMDLYQKLQAAGVETVIDDRDERAGVKFKDADLIGYPVRITVGKKWTEAGQFELKQRREKEAELLAPQAAIDRVLALIAAGTAFSHH